MRNSAAGSVRRWAMGDGRAQRPPDPVGPGLAPFQPVAAEGEWLLTVGRERFRVRLRPRHGPRYEYDYDWLTRPHDDYGFGVSGPFEHSDDAHRVRIRDFLDSIDLASGYLREE